MRACTCLRCVLLFHYAMSSLLRFSGGPRPIQVNRVEIMTAQDVLSQLESLATPSTKKTLLRHGAVEPLFGVRIGDLKPLQKKLKGQQQLAMELYATGNSDAMYLAGLIADGAKMSRDTLDAWAEQATWHMIASCTVAWVAVEHAEAVDMGLAWIDSPKPLVQIAGWSTLGSAACMKPDESIPIKTFDKLLNRCVKSIGKATGRLAYTMNSFVICVGTYVGPLAEKALEAARKIGVLNIDMGDTSCKVPVAESYILTSRRGQAVAPKRKTCKC